MNSYSRIRFLRSRQTWYMLPPGKPPPEPCPPRIAVPSSATPDLHSPTQPFAPTRVVMAPPPASVMGGTRPDPCCAEQMAATAAQLASPHTPWNATRVQSRLPPAYDMGLLGASPSMMPPPACGINALTSLPPLDPSQPAQLAPRIVRVVGVLERLRRVAAACLSGEPPEIPGTPN